MKENRNGSGLSRYHIFNAMDDSLKRLQLDHIDILYVHGVDFKTSLEDIVHSLNDVVESGKVRYIVICNWPAWMVAKAQAIAHYNGWHKFIGHLLGQGFGSLSSLFITICKIYKRMLTT